MYKCIQQQPQQTHTQNADIVLILQYILRCVLAVLHLDLADALGLQLDDLVLHPVSALPPGAGAHLLCAQTACTLSGKQGGLRQVTAGCKIV